MYKIHKYIINQTNNTSLDLPLGSVPLSVQEQHGITTVWIHVSDSAIDGDQYKSYRFYGVMTGQNIEKGHPKQYLGTVLYESGSFVVHYFYEAN